MDEQGVFRVVPTNPPTVPAKRLLPNSPCLVYPLQPHHKSPRREAPTVALGTSTFTH